MLAVLEKPYIKIANSRVIYDFYQSVNVKEYAKTYVSH